MFQDQDAESANIQTNAHHAMVDAHSHMVATMLQSVLKHPQVASAVNGATKAGVPFWQIITAIIPMILAVFNGSPLNLQAIIAAINALIHPVVPPVPPTPPAPINQ